MGWIWNRRREQLDSQESGSGSSLRGTVRLPLISAGGAFAIVVAVLVCLIPLRDPRQAVRPAKTHLHIKYCKDADFAAFSNDGHHLAWSAYDDTVRTLAIECRWLASGAPLTENQIGKSAAFSADGALLALGLHDGKVKLRETGTGASRLLAAAPGYPVRSVAFAPDQTLLAAGSADSKVVLWDLPSGSQRGTLQGHHAGVRRLAFSPDGRALASSDETGLVIVWDWSSGRRLATISPELSPIHSVVPLAFAPDGKLLAFTTGSSLITFWDLAAGKRIVQLGELSRPVMALAVSPDGRFIASGGVDGQIELWDLDTHTRTTVLREHEGAVLALVFSSDGERLLSAGGDGGLRLWLRGHDYP
jgi:WD40 repeat protein